MVTVHSDITAPDSDWVDGMLSEYSCPLAPNHKWGSSMLSSPGTQRRGGKISAGYHAESPDQRSQTKSTICRLPRCYPKCQRSQTERNWLPATTLSHMTNGAKQQNRHTPAWYTTKPWVGVCAVHVTDDGLNHSGADNRTTCNHDACHYA